ncbi:MAG TPA: hypothetical protein VLQ89_04705 [Candidatus Binatia bacterium]|nr:hypothetical protein [Candidatus Binatia bacterium]
MKFTIMQRKTVSSIVLVAFVALLHFWAAPARAAEPAVDSGTTLAQGDSAGPGVFEQEQPAAAVNKKEKKVPWLIVGLGAAAVGIALYLLVFKKAKYTLNVTLGAGVSGTPAATGKYGKGTVVQYNYTTSSGYMAQVRLDGTDAPASGTVTMDRDHTLVVTTEPSYTLTVSLGANASGTPAATTQYPRGAVVSYSYTAASGYGLDVKLDGVTVPASGTIPMNNDRTLTVVADPLDIRGTWQLSMFYLDPDYYIYNYTSTWTFVGTRENGTFTEVAGTMTNYGTYSVTGLENVWFKYDNAGDIFVGKITGRYMSGTFANGSTYNGTWGGSKQ